MKLLGVVRRKRAALLVSTALQASVVVVLAVPGFTRQAAAQPAPNARPTGGTVIAGSASISRAPAQTTINQSSNRAALSWQTYNVGSQQSVVYHQPSSSSVTLNRVEDSNPSQIAGRIEANGSIVLMNQAGVTFYKGAQVNTNGLMVTAASMSDSAMKGFVNTGAMKFDRAPDANARVENRGNITVRQAGLAALVAPSVANSGTITARLGHVVLAGAEHTTLDMYGDGLVSIDVSGEVKKVPVGPDGKPVTALVTNTGVIRADGGTVQLTAREADGLVSNLVDAGGRISANTVNGHTGVVALNGIGGDIVVQGQLSAAGRVAGARGGDVEVNTTGNVTVASSARIDASGRAGGGTVALGTTLARAKGGPSVTPTLTAANVQVHKGAVIRADATAKGNGGRVTVLSTGTTSMDGDISAKGGPQGGDGGFAEVSGQVLGFNGSANVGAPLGHLGTVLFDPGTLDIVGTGTGSLDGTLTGSTPPTIGFGADGTTSSDTVSNTAIESVTGSILLQATTQLTVSAPITLTGTGQALTLESGDNLAVNAAISTAGNITLGAAVTDPSGALTINAPVSTTQGTLALSAGTGGISIGALLTAPTLDLTVTGTTGGGVTSPGGSLGGATLNVGTLVSSGGVNGSVALGQDNTVATIGSFAVTGGSFEVTDAAGKSLTVSGPLTADQGVTLTTSGTGGITASGSIGATAGTVALAGGSSGIALSGNITGNALDLQTTGGGVTQSGGGVNVGTLTSLGTVVGSVALNNDNSIGAIGTFTVAGSGNSFSLTNAANQSLAISGPLTAPKDVSLATSGTGSITATGSINASAGTLALTSGSGGIALNTGAILTAPFLVLNSGSGAIGLAGDAVLGQAGATVDLTAGDGVSETGTGSIIAGTLQSTGGVSGGDVTLGNANAIGTIGSFAVTGGSFTLAEATNQDLTVSGPLTAKNGIGLATSGTGSITATGSINATNGTLALTSGSGGIALNTGAVLTAPFLVLNSGSGAIGLAGDAVLGQAGATVDLIAGDGVSETGTGSIIAGTLQSTGGVSGGDVTLGNANAIGTIGSFAVTGGSFTLAEATNQDLTVSGPLTAKNGIGLATSGTGSITATGSINATNGTLALTSGSGGIALNTGAVLTAPFLVLNSGSGAIGLAGDAVLGQAGATVDLTTGDGVSEAGTGSIIAGTLQSTGGVSGGDVTLGNANAIGTIGSFAVTGGSFTLAEATNQDLTVSGPLTAKNGIGLTTSGTGSITATGSIAATNGTLALTSGSGGIALNTGAILTAPFLVLNSGSGAIGLAGDAVLGQAGATVDLTAGDGVSETGTGSIIAGTLQSTGGVSGGDVTLGNANAIGTIGSFAVTGGSFTLAEATNQDLAVSGPLTAKNGIGLTTSGSAAIAVTGSIGATAGTVALAGGSSGIALSGNITGNALDLQTTGGGVTQSGGGVNVGTLTSLGTVVGSVALNNDNSIGAIGTFTVAGSGNSFSLTNAANQSLAVSGPLTAPKDVSLATSGTGSITATGSINATNGTLALTSGSGGIALNTGAVLTAPFLVLNSGSGAIGLAGDAVLGQAGATVDLIAGDGVSEAGTGSIIAGTLQSTGGVSGGDVTLGNANAIGTIGSFAVTGGSFTLAEATNQDLAVSGPLTAKNGIGLTTSGTGSITVAGSIGAGTALALAAGSGGIGLTGTAALSGDTVDLSSTGTVSENSTALISADTLLSSGNVTGTVSLLSGNNQVGTLGTFQTGSDFLLRNSIPLTITGLLHSSNGDVFIQESAGSGLTVNGGSIIATGHTIGLVADSFSASSGTIDAGVAENGTVEIAPATQGRMISLAGTNGLALDSITLSNISAGVLRLGGYHDLPNGGADTISAGDIDVAGIATLGTGAVATLWLNSRGQVGESAGTLSVGTLVGTAANGFTLTAGNSIGALGGTLAGDVLTASTGNIFVRNDTDLAVQNTVSAPDGNVFLDEAAGSTLSLLNTGTILAGTSNVSAGRIGLVADTLSVASGAGIIAYGGAASAFGTVEIAPQTAGSVVSLAGNTGLGISATALGAVRASLLRIGGYLNQIDGNANTVTAGSIDIAGLVNLSSANVPALRLDSTGPVTESAGALNVATLSVSTNGGPGDVTLDKTNAIDVLASVAVAGGNFVLNDHSGSPGSLNVPSSSVVYANNVTITNQGSIVLAGSIGACATAGSLVLTAGTGDIGVDNSALLGANGLASLTALDGSVTQNGGLINAQQVTIAANQAFTQNGGTIAGLDTNVADVGVYISAGLGFSQDASGVIASNSQFQLTAGDFDTSGRIVGVGSGTIATDGTLSQTGGTIAAGQTLTLRGATLSGMSNISQQNSALIVAGNLLSITSLGTLSQDAGSAIGGATADIATQDTLLPNFTGAASVTSGGSTVDCYCGGATGVPPALPGAALLSNVAHHIILTQPAILFGDKSLTADWVELHSTGGETAENGSGIINADLLTGSSTGSVDLRNTNQVNHLGSFAAGGDFQFYNADAVPLTVIGTVSVGNGDTLSLQAGTLAIDRLASDYTVSTAISGLPVTDTVPTAGLLSAPSLATVSGGTTITPGSILLRTDDLVFDSDDTNPLVSAPDGVVAIAPLTNGTSIDLAAGGTSSAGTLVLTQAMLNAIDTLGSSAGTAGTQTLVLGSLDGATPYAGGIDINSGIVLTGITRNLVLDTTGAVQENAGGSLSVVSLAGMAGTGATNAAGGSITLTNGNTIAELGNVATRTVGGVTYVSSGTPATGLLNLTAKGDVRVTDSTGSLVAVGGVTANTGGTFASGTIALTAPALDIISGTATLPTGTISSAGLLLASAGTITSGTLTPSRILLLTDNLHIDGTAGTPIVRAPSGEVAIAPFTSGDVIAIDSTASSSAGTLSLGTADLALIDTMSGPLSGVTPGPTGTQTLALGSLDDGATITAGGISINTPITLGGTANLTGNTLALYSTGNAVETPAGGNPAGSVAVNTLVGTISAGSFYLNGTNQIASLGNLATRGGITTPNPVNAGLTAANGNVLVRSDTNLNVVTTVQAGSASPDYAELDVHGGGNLTVLDGGTVTARDVYLRAGDDASSGNVTVAAGGAVVANGDADLAAGVQYIAATPTSAPSHSYTQSTGTGITGAVAIEGNVHAGTTGTIGLYARNNIDEPLVAADAAAIQGGVLTGFAGGHAYLLGYGSPTDNLITDLAHFTTNNGFVLHDAGSLAIIGSGVTDATTGITIAVAAPGTVAGLFGAADLVLGAPVVADSGTVKLEATGNVYETDGSPGTPGTISNPAGTFAAPGGAIDAATLVAQSGAIPDTETDGNAPGTVPAAAGSFGRAIAWFGNVNNVATLGNVSATGNFLLNNGRDLTVAGTVMAGTLPLSVGTLAAADQVVAGPFGTSPNSTPAPFAEIDVVRSGTASSGNLTIASSGVVHAGLDGAVTGNVTLRAGNATTPGSVTIGTAGAVGGDVFAANGGTVAISAGYDPSQPAGSQYDAACASTACDIDIEGTVWGNSAVGASDLAGVVQLNAASSIEENAATSRIGATLLTGEALRHATLNQADAYGTFTAGNLIANLGSFTTNAGGFDDAQGFRLWDRRSLTLTGAVTDEGASNSSGIWLVVAPGNGSSYSAGDLTLANTLSAATTVVLQTTGAISEEGGGVIDAKTLSVQAGLIPYPESFASNFPGETPQPGGTVEVASVMLNNANHIANLGTPTLGVTTTGDFSLSNVGDMHVGAGVLSTTGNITINDSGAVTNGSLISSPMQNVSISAITIANAGQITAASDVVLSGNSGISNDGLISAGHDALLTAAAGDIDNGSLLAAGALIQAGNVARLTAGGSINGASDSTITASGQGSAGVPSVALVSQGGSIAFGVASLVSATDSAGVVSAIAASSIQAGGTIMAGGTASPTGTVLLTAQGGDITQSVGSGGPSGVIDAGLLTGSAGGSVLLNTSSGQGNRIVTVGSLSAGGGDLSLIDFRDLAVLNAIAATPGSVSIVVHGGDSTSGNLAIAGAAAVTGATNVVLAADNGVTNQGSIRALSGSASVNAAGGDIDNGASATISGASSVALTAHGSINEAAGGAIAATGSPGTVNLTAQTGSISATGFLQAQLLNAYAGLSALLRNSGSPGDQIATLGSFTVAGSSGWLMLNDGGPMQIAGPLDAQTIDIDVGTNLLTFNPGAAIITGGVFRNPGSLTEGQLPRSPFRPQNTGIPRPGAYFFAGSVRQTGVLTVTGTSGSAPNILRIDVTSGPITFDPAAGLNAGNPRSNTWLILNGGAGSISGAINVKALDLIYSGTLGGAALTGTINGFSGQIAAGQANIEPARSSKYHVNSCPIHSVSCVLLPTESIPTANPLDEIFLGSFFNPQDEGDLLLPIVSDQDY